MKRFVRLVVTSSLWVSLTLLALLAGLNASIGNPEVVKGSLVDSGVYESITDDLINDSLSQNVSADITQGLRESANQAYSPEFIQETSEQTLDDLYTWLQGDSEEFTVSIDLRENNQLFATRSAAIAGNRYTGLPSCQPAQLETLQGIDPFTVPCQVPGIASSDVSQSVYDEFIGNDALPDTIVYSTEQARTTSGPIPLESTPAMFQLIRTLPFILIASSIALILVTAFLYQERYRGLLRIGSLFLSAGIFGALSAIAFRVFALGTQVGGTGFQSALKSTAQDVATTFVSTLTAYSIGYVLLGGLFIAIGLLRKRHYKQAMAHHFPDVPPQQNTLYR